MLQWLFLSVLSVGVTSHAAPSSMSTLSANPWTEGYSVRMETEVESRRDKKTQEINGYETELEMQVRKKLSKTVSVLFGGELKGKQKEDGPAYYDFHQSILGARYKWKALGWKMRSQFTLHYYNDEEYREDKGVDGAVRLRLRGKRRLGQLFDLRLRTRYHQYIANSSEEGTRVRRVRFDLRPAVRINPVRIGLITRLEHRIAVDEEENFVEFGPMVRWDITDDIHLIYAAQYEPWTSTDGNIDGYEETPTHQLEFQVTL